MTLSTQLRQSKSGLWTEPGLEANQASLEKPENGCAPTFPIQPEQA